MVQPAASELEITVDHATTAGACALISAPAWITTVNPYLQFAGLVIGIAWVVVQMYFKFKKGS